MIVKLRYDCPFEPETKTKPPIYLREGQEIARIMYNNIHTYLTSIQSDASVMLDDKLDIRVVHLPGRDIVVRSSMPKLNHPSFRLLLDHLEVIVSSGSKDRTILDGIKNVAPYLVEQK
ncbi:hypothetical protein J4217_01565 [Candidatus Pacearchaeota archaeon]|nr:hypothetical protein [Candidatus Pacearchaeota archaeon]